VAVDASTVASRIAATRFLELGSLVHYAVMDFKEETERGRESVLRKKVSSRQCRCERVTDRAASRK
jgi:hypothetical protein